MRVKRRKPTVRGVESAIKDDDDVARRSARASVDREEMRHEKQARAAPDPHVNSFNRE